MGLRKGVLMSRPPRDAQPSAARVAFLTELARLLQEFPDRWSRATLRTAVMLAEEHRASSVFDLLDRIQGVLSPPPPSAA
jgi:hypothetical protein